MNTPVLQAGDVLPLSLRLPIAPDPLALWRALSPLHQSKDAVLLESADLTTRSGERSILMPKACVRVCGRGGRLTFTPLCDNGDAALAWLATRLPEATSVRFDDRVLVAEFPRPKPDINDAERLSAPSCKAGLRELAMGFRLVSRPAPFAFGALGVLAYDLIDAYEDLPNPAADPLGFPDLTFWLPEALIVIDHVKRHTVVLAHVFGGPGADTRHLAAAQTIDRLTRACEQAAQTSPRAPASPRAALPSPSVDLDDHAFAAVVTTLKEHIVNGDVFQIVPSRTFSVPCTDPLGAYERLRHDNPSPYMYFVAGADFTLFGASPETCVKVGGTPRQIEIRPIAGTRPRGKQADGSIDFDLDSRFEAELRLHDKELAEHMMLVDLARNDVARLCVPGSRQVARLLSVERYSEVMHLVTHVVGELRPEIDALTAYLAAMNMGTLVGAPKLKATELLRRYESSKRGPYGGAVGYLTDLGELDTAIVIRSAYVANGLAHVRAGAGVVFDSDPAAEAAETRAKANAVLRVLCALEAAP
jgi:anthranilate synthase component 1